MIFISWPIIHEIDIVGQNCRYPLPNCLVQGPSLHTSYTSSVCKRILAVPKDYIDISNIPLDVGNVKELLYYKILFHYASTLATINLV